jgi:hypothetical protein
MPVPLETNFHIRSRPFTARPIASSHLDFTIGAIGGAALWRS